ncbi:MULTISPECIES: TlpA family protein disulfide reductase [Microbacterium]|uniref:TlpA family protein disulfide reductase n=1 Tax=Microbacterium wangchenii TaxID=2541726 RepID=A0ABX5SX69_9MICO|nr:MULTISPECIES: TlpA disulfide reductase family protein [Microbacterium]MCK6067200.1 TlpA family protein disulfide reductase [Microbacterium sp. EYE_512]QBR89847.1 TlpA family protein disulfide reductase [Microbacterium wangchenii]TFV85294.1 TlpA family protein disulfide reductase [Microbacterium sp. dk485]TXK16556.1 TlpA family protein disulfide reductase [Microbacterium wangchenii]
MRRRLLAASLTAALAFGLGACAADPLADQYRAGDNKGYIAANGFQTSEIPAADRGERVEFAGVTETGAEVSDADYAGQVLVVNFWYAACGPCIVEAPRLEEAYESFEGQDVAFLGVNTYDQAATAASFARDNGVSYPSVIDVNGGAVKLAFAEHAPLTATPVTLVLDKEGRVAARIIGELPEASILQTIVRDVLAEPA